MRENKMNKNNNLASCIAAVLLVPCASAGDARAMLEEVVVTAQKRAESLQDVPISVSAVGGEKLSDAGIEKVEDLTLYVPNIHMTETGVSTQLRIRGIGSGNNSGFEQSVGQYVDGIYYGRQQLIRAPFLDLERVEVLRGPQSILFGKNSIAGALNFTTAKPGEDFEANLALSHEFEATDATEITAMVSGALMDSLYARLALRSFDSHGYMTNAVNGKNAPEKDEDALRATLVWEHEDFTATFKAERDTFDTVGRQTEIVLDQGGMGAILNSLSAIGGIGFDDKFDYKNYGTGEFSETELNNYTLTVESTLGENILTLVSGWVDYDLIDDCDCDFTNTDILRLAYDEQYQQFSQEIRLMSPGGERLDWITGLFFQTSDLDYFENAIFPSGGFLQNSGSVLGNKRIQRDFTTDSDLWAIFGQATLMLSDNVRVTLGARYTQEEKKGSRELNLLNDDTGLPNTIHANAVEAALGVFTEQSSGHSLADTRDESAFTPLVNVQWDVNDTAMVYASASSGFKSGGFDTRAMNPASFEFDEERAIAYEVGAKTQLLDNSLEFNIAYFYTDYEDLQVSQFDGALSFTVGNAKKSVVQGVEIDGRWAATQNLLVIYSASYNDFEFKDFSNGNCYNLQTPDGDVANGVPLCDYSGKSSSFAPKIMANLSLDYSHPLNDLLELRSTLDLQYVDNHNVHPNQDPLFDIDSFTTINLRVGLDGDSWSVALLGKNLTDEKILSNANNLPLSNTSFGTNSFYAFAKAPRTIAAEVRYSW
jgi:iron complex outermembrane recepter protein